MLTMSIWTRLPSTRISIANTATIHWLIQSPLRASTPSVVSASRTKSRRPVVRVRSISARINPWPTKISHPLRNESSWTCSIVCWSNASIVVRPTFNVGHSKSTPRNCARKRRLAVHRRIWNVRGPDLAINWNHTRWRVPTNRFVRFWSTLFKTTDKWRNRSSKCPNSARRIIRRVWKNCKKPINVWVRLSFNWTKQSHKIKDRFVNCKANCNNWKN